jgi:long-subunit fatty acid transport protein
MFLNFGAMIKLPSVYSIEEKYSIYGESDFEQTYFVYDSPGQPFEYEITTPMEIAGGISASFPFITLNLSTKFVDYSQLEFSDGFRENELFQMNEEISEVFESTFNWNFGAEFTLPYPSLKFRGGFIYNPSPYVGDSQEFDKKYITGGIGFPIAKRLLFDFAFVHGWWEDFGDNYGIEQSRTYQDIKLNKLVFSLSYIFM